MGDLLDALSSRVVLYDGGMGATLEQLDLTAEDYGNLPGKCHELLVLRRPDVIEAVHRSMFEAGAEVVETNTFQASRLKLEEWGLGDLVEEINREAARLARRVVGSKGFVAGSIGPTGKLPASEDPELGAISFKELVAVFEQQAAALLEGGVDLLIIETAQDILEVKAAIFGARRAFARVGRSVPIHASISLLAQSSTMLLGTDISSALTTLEALGADVIGVNCSTGPELMREAVRFLGEHCAKPVACIPNAGIPQQGPNGETIFPERPEPFAQTLAEFVERYGVGVVGGCCGTRPEHIEALARLLRGRPAPSRPAPRPPHLSSMIAATPLAQDPPPTLVGERLNGQGSRRAKQLLLEDNYDGLLEIAAEQIAGGAHVLDVCVALTERTDEAEQMRTLVKKLSLTQPAPLQIDSTEPEVIEAALEQIPGRPIINSVNLEGGRGKLDRVCRLAVEHGAALIALTIDEQGMARNAERKLQIAQRIHGIACGEHGLDPQLLIFDPLTFTLTTGEEQWRDSALQTIEGIKLIKAALPGVKTSLGISNVSFGVSPPARALLNSVFLHHCTQAGLDLALVNPAQITPYPEIDAQQRELADDLIFNRRPDALERLIAYFEGREAGQGAGEEEPEEGLEPEQALYQQIVRRKKEGVERWVDACVEKIGAVPTLNEVMLPAMKEVGDRFGAGELILPFVLQSAEVMKRAVARLERYLERIEGYTKGTVVLATVFGDVHDIGKSLVNTILTNNGYTVVDLGKQVPVERIIEAAKEHNATAIGLSALLVSTSKQMVVCIQELHRQQLPFPVLIGGAAINRAFGYRALYPDGEGSDRPYAPGVFYCKDAFEGLAVMDQLIDPERRAKLVAKVREEAAAFRAADRKREQPNLDDSSVRSAARTDVPIPTPPFWGVREIPVDLGEVYPHLDTHVLFKLHWGGRGVKGEAWRRLVSEEFLPRLERMWREQDLLEPRALLGFFPCYALGNELVVLDPGDPDRELARLRCPRQPGGVRLCLADFFRPAQDGKPPAELDVVALQAVTVGGKATQRIKQLEAEGRFADQLYVHGLSVQTAEALAEWLHARVREWYGIPPHQGRRYSWGYPAIPDQSEHLKVDRLLDLSRIGVTLTGGYAPEPEQTTLALIAHHPQAIYFGTRQGRLPQGEAPDELIKGSAKDPTKLREGLIPSDEDEEEPAAMAPAGEG